MACPIKKEKIQEKKNEKEQFEREKAARPYSEVIKKTVQESQSKVTPTQIVLGTEYGYKITTCIIHAHFVNMARPETYETTLNKMLKAKGLPPVVVPEDVFWMKITAKMGVATSRESVMTGILGFQEEGLEEMVLGDEVMGGNRPAE